jgi:signal transduction histidine kinase
MRRAATLTLAPAAVAYGLIAVGVATRHGELTTYAGRSAGAALTEVIAGWAVIGAGIAAWLRWPRRPAGPLAVLAGFAWFAPDWIGWQTGPGAVRALGLATAGVTAAAIAQLALVPPKGSPSSPWQRALVATVWVTTAVVGIGRALLYDPLADPGCVTWCSTNPLLVDGSRPVARALDWVELALAVLMTVAVAGGVAGRLVRSTRAARRSLLAVAVPSALFLAAWAVHVVVVVTTPGEDPSRAVLMVTFVARAVSLGLLAGGLAWLLGCAAREATAMRRLARLAGVHPAGESLHAALVRATGDASLDVAFPLRDAERWVDARGNEVQPPRRGADRSVTTILREGQAVAAVLHHPVAVDGVTLQREIGSAAQIAVDNERLRAEGRAQLRELKASRARIVQAGDAERRALERDLHDGAQQRLVGLSIAVAMARSAFAYQRDGDVVAALDDADASLRRAIAALRELAHGIHPVELTEEGLVAALETLADRAPVPVRIVDVPEGRSPDAIEAAAYHLVDEAVRRAGGRCDRVTIDVRARLANGTLVVEVGDPGETSPDRARGDLVGVADRIGALDGRLSVDPVAPMGVLITAELPCG